MVGSRTPHQLSVIIPARGGSKGIPRKNMQLVGGVPMIGHTIRAALEADLPGLVYVSSDDDEILSWSRMAGAQTLHRPAAISGDDVPLVDVARHHAVGERWRGVVGVFQPTSPLRSAGSIRRAWELYLESDATSLGSVVPERHNLWHSRTGNVADARPIFASRVNRQLQPETLYRENGAIQFIDVPALIGGSSMITADHLLFDLPAREGLDIDEPADLTAARQWMHSATIFFRVRANRTVGSGHLYHCLQLAHALSHYDLRFVLVDCDPFVGEVLTEQGYAWDDEGSMQDTLGKHVSPAPTLVVNDVLDTSVADIAFQRSLGFRVVCIEDLGPGAALADWVVNALYPPQADQGGHVSTGARFATLRPQFIGLPPPVIRDRAERVLVTFGGTDPNNVAVRVAGALADSGVALRVVVGPGAADQTFPAGCEVIRSTPSMAAEMTHADVVVTSAGRTVYEAAATGTPVVVVAQNVREATHAHLNYEFGVIFLGLAPLVTDHQIATAVDSVLQSTDLRSELSQRLRASLDNRGVERIARRIENLLEGL